MDHMAAQMDSQIEGAISENERLRQCFDLAIEALDEIALAGMAGTGQESDESMTAWHARQAWKFIRIAAQAKGAIQELHNARDQPGA